VAEDEAFVRCAAKIALERQGYQVLLAENAGRPWTCCAAARGSEAATADAAFSQTGFAGKPLRGNAELRSRFSACGGLPDDQLVGNVVPLERSPRQFDVAGIVFSHFSP
jgi:hypothetical protein